MEIQEMVKRQRSFFEKDITKSLLFREKALFRLEKAIKEQEKDIIRALHQDLKKSSFEAYMTEIGLALSDLSYVRKHLRAWQKPHVRHTPLAQLPAISFEVSEPYGVALVMAPWNYPFLLSIEPLIGAIAAGNCCILKPSAYAPAVSAVLRNLISSIFPSEFVCVVEGGREANAALLEQRFDYIFFTGGVQVGKLVMQSAAEHLTPVTLELGGKSPCIVEKSADLKKAARSVVFGKYLNSGQTCVAPDYVLVQEEAAAEFLGYLKYWIHKMLGKEPLNNPDYPRMIHEKHYERVMGLIQGENVYEGGYGSKEALQIAPTILTHVKDTSPVMQEEIFGPVLPVKTYKNLESAEAFIRKREKPLALYLFTGEAKTERRILKHLSFGGGCINDTIVHLATPYMGFGGVGESGMGNYHGKQSFEAFSHKKSIMKKYNWLEVPIRYQPYSKGKELLLRLLL